MFAIPWHGHTVVGTTDTPIPSASLEPVALEQEIEFILQTAALYLEKKPTRADILSVFAGVRPLVRSGEAGNTAALSRDHTIRIENTGMITVCGGKWTTYRHMAEDCVNQAATLARLPERPCVTEHLKHPRVPSLLGEVRSVVDVWIGRAPGAAGRGERSARWRTAVHRRASYLGGARRDGADSRGCSGATHPSALPECPGCPAHGAEGRTSDGRGIGTGCGMGGKATGEFPGRRRRTMSADLRDLRQGSFAVDSRTINAAGTRISTGSSPDCVKRFRERWMTSWRNAPERSS